RRGVDVGAGEVPAVIVLAQQRIDAIGAGADVQRANAAAAGDVPLVVGGQQVGQAVHVIGTSRDRRAQITWRNVPVANAVELTQQGAVEDPYGLGVGEVDALLAIRIEDDELCQFRTIFDQCRKVITALMAVARVQRGLGRGQAGSTGHDGHRGKNAGAELSHKSPPKMRAGGPLATRYQLRWGAGIFSSRSPVYG